MIDKDSFATFYFAQNDNKLEKLELLRWVFLRRSRKNTHLNSILPVTLVIPNPGIG